MSQFRFMRSGLLVILMIISFNYLLNFVEDYFKMFVKLFLNFKQIIEGCTFILLIRFNYDKNGIAETFSDKSVITLTTTACGHIMFETLVVLLKSVAIYSKNRLNIIILTDVLKERLTDEVFNLF